MWIRCDVSNGECGLDVMLVMVNVKNNKPNVFVFIDSHVFDVTLTDNFTVSRSII